MDTNEEEQFLQQFKLRRMIKKLKEAEGNGTSLISLIIPAGKKVSDFSQMLTEEMGKAENIKDRVNRQSVKDALTSAKEKLKSYKTIDNGLAIFCGNVLLAKTNTIKKIMIAIEPYRKITSKLYNCGDKFDLGPLEGLLVSHESYGFVIVDGNGTLFGKLEGNMKTVLHRFTVDLPKKHGRGGQSQNRFAHIRDEKRLIYVKKVCEEIKKIFITNDKPNVKGLILGGYADFKTNVFENQTFDIRLKPIVLKVVDIAYGMDQGFNQAISLSQDCFKNVRLVQEQKMLRKFTDHINLDTSLVMFGVNETMKCLKECSVETLIVYDNLDYQIVDLKSLKDGEITQKYIKLDQVLYKSSWIDKTTEEEYTILDYDSLVDWIGEHYTEFGCILYYVSDLSPEGHQFVQGFAGIGAILKYKVQGDDFEHEYNEDDYDVDDFI
jgi:peptide chain release factor subunit 1